MSTSTTKNNGATQNNFAVIPNSITQLSELKKIADIKHLEPFAAIAQQAVYFKYFVELKLNNRIHKKQITQTIEFINEQFRYIVNNQLRYQQKQNNIPKAFGVRFFGCQKIGPKYYSCSLMLLCSDALVIEFICRAWCDRVNQYPHELFIVFDNQTSAKNVMPDKKQTKLHYDNLNINRCGNTICENYNISNPFRLEYYIGRNGFQMARFGSTAFIYKTQNIHFDQTDFVDINPDIPKWHINNIYIQKGKRTFQTWGAIKSAVEVDNTKNNLTIKRKTNTSTLAKKYYSTCKAGHLTYNTYIHQRLKQKDRYKGLTTPALNQLMVDKFVDTLAAAVEEIERLRAIIEQ